TEGVLVPTFGTIQLVDLRSGAPAVTWSQANSSWICADLPRMEATWSTSASQGMRQVALCQDAFSERPVFLVAQRKSSAEPPFPTTVTAMRAGTDGRPEPLWHVSGLPGDPELSALAPAAGGVGALVRLRTTEDADL